MRVILGVVLGLLLVGCSSTYSLREQAIVAHIPDQYRSYSDGIIPYPSDEEISAAVEFGKQAKDDNSLDYAYIFKPEMSGKQFLRNIRPYVWVETPLYLAANHAKRQSQEYRPVEKEFLEYCKRIDLVKISLVEQTVSLHTYNTYVAGRQIILLRNGKRVEPVTHIPGYKGINPYTLNKQVANYAKQMAAMTAKIQKDMQNIARMYGSQIGIDPPSTTGAGLIPVSESDGIYRAKDLNQPGKYEIVYRVPPSGNLVTPGEYEERFEIDFSTFK